MKNTDSASMDIRLGKVRRHRFEGQNPVKCERCSEQFSSVTHK